MKRTTYILSLLVMLIGLGYHSLAQASEQVAVDSEIIIQPTNFLTAETIESDDDLLDLDEGEYTYPDTDYIEYDPETGEYRCIEDYDTFIEDDGTIICTRYEVEIEEPEVTEFSGDETFSEIIPGQMNFALGGGACSLNTHPSSVNPDPIFKGLILLLLPLLLYGLFFRTEFKFERVSSKKEDR